MRAKWRRGWRTVLRRDTMAAGSVLLVLLLSACAPAELASCGRVVAHDVLSVTSLDVSADGRYLAVVHHSTYSLHLKVIELETGRALFDGDDFHHTLPPSSQSIRAVNWLDNGSHLLYGDGTAIRSLDVLSKRVTLVTGCHDCWGFDLLPDGRTLAVLAGSPHATHIEIHDLLNGASGRVMTEAGHAVAVNWSPDAKRAALVDKGRIIIYDLMTRQQSILAPQWHNGVPPTWLSDVDVLLPDPHTSMLWRVNVVNGERRAVTDAQLVKPLIGRIIAVAGSRDGQFLAIQPERGNVLAVVDMSCLVRP